MIQDFKTPYGIRKIFREIKLLRKLSEIENNIFSTKILDVVLPPEFDGINPSAKLSSKTLS